MGNAWSPCLKSGLQECKRDADGLCPGFSARRRNDSGPKESTALSPDGWAPTFLELDLQSVRDTGGFGWVLGLSVEAWGRLVLTKDRKKLEVGCLLSAKQGYASPWTPCSPLLQRSAPLSRIGGLLAVQEASHSPAHGQLRLPGAWETKGSRNQTIFPLNLISSFSLTPPQLEVEKQERNKSGRKSVTLEAEAQAAAFGGLSGSGRARSRRLPGLGFILHGPQS